MSRAGIFETVVGVIVIAVAAIFLFYAYQASGEEMSRGAYRIEAVFGRVDGIAIGSEVRIAGVKVGSVAGHSLDLDTYEAKLDLAVAAGVPIPEDSVAKIVSDGLLGGAYVSIEPGASDVMLAPGERIALTQGSVDLLGLAVQAFTANAGSGEAEKSEPSADGL
ncbi:MlaD family protein [Amphiplicatus metriothermophilus]|uniref:Phospholipid/cholesterol/gamma-HCH transport system substrate-binding protein n=1 Tax=Amphiplicatus metriothermophilus TaxID=1519374 RepID=A0A239PW58_9PROT|nr:MlaD family protein [Amphiplicatus metriothermophilus]MBB5519618.1 phospholipid/cholesterol/gamma-HCH transport system substrate-binding protein [Amphiplicatus metriothermophilus]SNT74182.1 phospholipid/cholesterol/gamma-HCH transport system substrate-binding protein [Amphiplicatus metriothermophilus]